MSEWIFKGYTWLATRTVVFLTIYFIFDAMAYAVTNQYIAMGISICFALVTAPFIFVTYGGIKYKGLSSKFIDLAEYAFGEDSLHEDFKVSVKEMNKLNDMLEKDFHARKSETENLFTIARDLAIKHKLGPKEYFLLLIEAAVHMGEIREKTKGSTYGPSKRVVSDSELKDKIRALKEKMEAERKPSQDDNSTEGKYGFL